MPDQLSGTPSLTKAPTFQRKSSTAVTPTSLEEKQPLRMRKESLEVMHSVRTEDFKRKYNLVYIIYSVYLLSKKKKNLKLC